MADSVTVRTRRSRAHQSGDHSLCDPAHPCDPAPAADAWGRPAVAGRLGADDITTKIRSGAVAAGSKLPTHYALAEIYDVSLSTVQRAMTMVRERGLTHGERGRAV